MFTPSRSPRKTPRGCRASTTSLINVVDTAPEVSPASATEDATQGPLDGVCSRHGDRAGPVLRGGDCRRQLGRQHNLVVFDRFIRHPARFRPRLRPAGFLPGLRHASPTPSACYGTETFTAAVAGVPPSPSILGVPSSINAGSTVTLGSSVSDASQAETGFGILLLLERDEEWLGLHDAGQPGNEPRELHLPAHGRRVLRHHARRDRSRQPGRARHGQLHDPPGQVPTVNVTTSNGTYNGSAIHWLAGDDREWHRDNHWRYLHVHRSGIDHGDPGADTRGLVHGDGELCRVGPVYPGIGVGQFHRSTRPRRRSPVRRRAASFGSTTLKATVTSSGGHPAGSVDFYDSTTMIDLGSASLNGSRYGDLEPAGPARGGAAIDRADVHEQHDRLQRDERDDRREPEGVGLRPEHDGRARRSAFRAARRSRSPARSRSPPARRRPSCSRAARSSPPRRSACSAAARSRGARASE